MNLINDESLRALIASVVAEVWAQCEAERPPNTDRLAYTEGEAAALLGVERHVLRDARLRGDISATRIGKRILYARSVLEEFVRPV